MEEIESLVGTDAADWLADEFAKPATTYLNDIIATRRSDGGFDDNTIMQTLYWDAMMTANDQLRTRMVFALSQILVVSQEQSPFLPEQFGDYTDILAENAFGNFRTLLDDVTYSPLMARFLTYFRNRRGDPDTGRMPDENYARELMQLFSIGLVELNRNGSVRRGADGNPIPTYDNDDIVGLARVFTGLAYDGERFFDGPTPQNIASRLKLFEEFHSPLEKSFLGLTIPPNTSGDESIRLALDEIFNHRNVAPFIARQLIQRFTASNPSPRYIASVADAFNSGRYSADNGREFGSGERGDLEATIAAILLDESIFASPSSLPNNTGKIREPLLRFIHWIRAFNVTDIEPRQEFRLFDTRQGTRLNQQFLRSPSVFNFYRPGYIAPQTLTGERQLTAPELQILNTTSATGYINFMTDFILDRTGSDNEAPRFTPDYSSEIPLADDPQALVARLDLLLTGGRLSNAARLDIARIVEAAPLRSDRTEEDRLRRVQIAIILTIASPAYSVVQ